MSTLNFRGLLDSDVYVLWALLFGPATVQVMSERTRFPVGRLTPACEEMVRRGLIKRDGNGTYSMTDMQQTVLWFKETRPGTVFPEHLR